MMIIIIIITVIISTTPAPFGRCLPHQQDLELRLTPECDRCATVPSPSRVCYISVTRSFHDRQDLKFKLTLLDESHDDLLDVNELQRAKLEQSAADLAASHEQILSLMGMQFAEQVDRYITVLQPRADPVTDGQAVGGAGHAAWLAH